MYVILLFETNDLNEKGDEEANYTEEQWNTKRLSLWKSNLEVLMI